MTKLYYAQVMALFLLLVGLLVAGSIFVVGQAQAVFTSESGCGCSSGVLAWWSWPLAFAGLVFVGFALFQIVRLVQSHLRFSRKLSAQHIPIPEDVATIISGFGVPFTMIASSRLEAFTIGFLRPRVVISTGLIRRLKPEELRAVLLHEVQHARSRHPLFTFILALAERTLRLPKAFVEYARFLAEREADRAALAQTNVRILASALLKVLHDDPQSVPVTVHAFSTTSLRIKRLAQEPLHLPRTLILQHVFFAFAAIAALALAAVLFSDVSPVYAEGGGMCTALQYCVNNVPQSIPTAPPVYLPVDATVLLTSF